MINHGSFSSNPKTEWLVDDTDRDRDMRLLEDFWYIDPNGKKWPAPTGSIINGASIPRPLWSTVGSPYTDDYRRASIVHDVTCNHPDIPRKDADVMFYHACLAGGCSPLQSKLLYAGVRIGAWASKSITSDAFSKNQLLFRVPFKATIDEHKVQKGFQKIAIDLKSLREDATIKELDAVIEKHIKKF